MSLHAMLDVNLLWLLKAAGFQVHIEPHGNTKVDKWLQLILFHFTRVGSVALLWIVLS